MECSRPRKRERGRSLSRAGLRQENPRDDEAYHTEMILPSAKIIFHDDLQLFGNAPTHTAATSRKLTVFGRFAAPFPSLFAPSRKRAKLSPRPTSSSPSPRMTDRANRLGRADRPQLKPAILPRPR